MRPSTGKKVKKTITVDDDLLEWVERRIKKKEYSSLSHCIEYALQQLKEADEER